MLEYTVYASLQDGGPKRVFGRLIVPIADGSDGYHEDCVVNEIMNAASAQDVRDCVWTAKPDGYSDAPQETAEESQANAQQAQP